MSHAKSALDLPLTAALQRLRHDADAAHDFARESLSPATRRAYQSDAAAFADWCRLAGIAGIGARVDLGRVALSAEPRCEV